MHLLDVRKQKEIAVAIGTLFWLVGCAVVVECLSGLRTDALHLLSRRVVAPA